MTEKQTVELKITDKVTEKQPLEVHLEHISASEKPSDTAQKLARIFVEQYKGDTMVVRKLTATALFLGFGREFNHLQEPDVDVIKTKIEAAINNGNIAVDDAVTIMRIAGFK